MKLGEMNAMLMAQHNSLVMTVNAALGGGDKNSGPDKGHDLAAGHATPEDAVNAINRAMMFG